MFDICPGCGSNQKGEPIPEKLKHTEACGEGPYFGKEGTCVDPDHHCYGKEQEYFYRSVGYYACDVTLFSFCPDCKIAWHRFLKGDYYWYLAARYMQDEGYKVHDE